MPRLCLLLSAGPGPQQGLAGPRVRVGLCGCLCEPSLFIPGVVGSGLFACRAGRGLCEAALPPASRLCRGLLAAAPVTVPGGPRQRMGHPVCLSCLPLCVPRRGPWVSLRRRPGRLFCESALPPAVLGEPAVSWWTAPRAVQGGCPPLCPACVGRRRRLCAPPVSFAVCWAGAPAGSRRSARARGPVLVSLRALSIHSGGRGLGPLCPPCRQGPVRGGPSTRLPGVPGATRRRASPCPWGSAPAHGASAVSCVLASVRSPPLPSGLLAPPSRASLLRVCPPPRRAR